MDFSVNIATREAIASEQEYVNILEREAQLHQENAAAIDHDRHYERNLSKESRYQEQESSLQYSQLIEKLKREERIASQLNKEYIKNISPALAQDFTLSSAALSQDFKLVETAVVKAPVIEKIEQGLIKRLLSSSSDLSHYLSRHTLHTITALAEGSLSPRVVSGAARLAGHAMEGAGGAIGAFGTSFLNTVGAVVPPAMAAAYAFSVIQGIKNEQIKEQEERYKKDLETYSSLWEEQNKLANKHNETQRERVLDRTKEFLTGRAASQNWATENLGWKADLGGFETYRQKMDINKLKEADFRERMKMLGYAENDARVRAGTFWFNQGKTVKDRTAWNWTLEHSGVYSNYAQTQRDIATAELAEENQKKILKFEETREQRRMENDEHYRITTHNQENLLKEVEKSLALETSDWNKW